MNRRFIIVLCIVIAVILGVVAGIFINNKENRKSDIYEENSLNVDKNVIENVQLLVTSNHEEKISPNCMLVFKSNYLKCGHILEKRIKVPEKLVNSTNEDVKKYYEDWNIENFTSNRVVFSKDCNGFCDEHFLIKEKDGYVAIYKIDEQENQILDEVTGIVINYLSNQDKELLKNGIKVIGKDKLNATIEDYE